MQGSVLLRVDDVNLKKTTGPLVVTEQGLSYEPQQLLIRIQDIKGQAISPPTAAKVSLKITLFDETSHVFRFTGGSPTTDEAVMKEKALDERQSVQDHITRLVNAYRLSSSRQNSNESLASGKSSTGSRTNLSQDEIKARQALLARDASLRKMHRELVMMGHLSEEEFWETRRAVLDARIEQDKQQVGLSSTMEHEVRPTASDGTDLKFTLTPSIIQAIFVHHPKIKIMYLENVPDKVVHKMLPFHLFCLSDKIKDVLFDKAAKEELEEMQNAGLGQIPLTNMLFDLEKNSNDRFEEYGNQPDVTMKPGSVADAVPLIRKLNHHGQVVVRSVQASAESEIPRDESSSEQVPRHKQILRDMIRIEDLEPVPRPSTIPLRIHDETKYFAKQNDSESTAMAAQQLGTKCSTVRRTPLLDDDGSSNCDTTFEVDSEACTIALDQINADIALIHQEKSCDPSTLLPPAVFEEIVDLNARVNEILCHFWMVYPATSSEKQNRLARMRTALTTMQTKLKLLPKEMEQGHVCSRLLYPLYEAVQHALHVSST